MSLKEHHIGLLSFELVYKGSEPAFKDVQANVYELDWEKCMLPVEEIFSMASLPDRITVIDKLDLVVNVKGAANLEIALMDNLPYLIKNALRELLRKDPGRNNGKEGEIILHLTPGDQFINHIDGNSSLNSVTIPSEEYLFNSWLYFLEKGVMPQALTQGSFDVIAFESAVLSIAEKKIQGVLNFFRESPARAIMCKRLARQFSFSFTRQFVQELKFLLNKKGNYEQFITSKISEIDFAIKTTDDWYSVLLLLTMPVAGLERLHDLSGTKSGEVLPGNMQPEEIISFDDRNTIKKYLDSLLMNMAPQPITERNDFGLSTFSDIRTGEATTDGAAILVPAGDENEKVSKIEPGDRRVKFSNKKIPIAREAYADSLVVYDHTLFNRPNDGPEVFYVNNAGLILLYPYIEVFLEAIGCMSNHGFINQVAKEKSVQALHYLCTGKSGSPEYYMPLEKTLCNMDIRETLTRANLLEEADYREGDKLLRTFIKHWDKLGNVSCEALRETFLQRAGKLSCSDRTIHLQVEAKSADVLLNYLPFGISIIHFPWLRKIIEPEWDHYIF